MPRHIEENEDFEFGPPPEEPCELCGRFRPLTFHHFIPRRLHRKPEFRRRYSKEELAAGISICAICHAGIHDLIPDHRVLARDFGSKEQLLADPRIVRHVRFSQKKST